MKQMQNIIIEYPTEARNILIQNPQLTYAMLQSLVVMGLISPREAVTMLHKRPHISSINLINNSSSVPIVPPLAFHPHLTSINFPMTTASSGQQQSQTNPNITGGSPLTRTDQEKAQLLMQILQLNEDQIAQLPADQRASIILLREQMQQSSMISL